MQIVISLLNSKLKPQIGPMSKYANSLTSDSDQGITKSVSLEEVIFGYIRLT
jgi:hypothetical protein